jgi:hypothetical protein
MIGRWVAGALALLMLAGCSAVARNPQVDAEARSAFDQLRRHEDAALTARMAPELRTPAAAAQLAALEGYLPAREPRSRTAVGTNTIQATGEGETVYTTDEYDFRDRRALVSMRFHRAQGQQAWQIEGLHADVATAAQLARNRMTLAGKSVWQILFLVLVIASPLTMIAALIKVIRTPGLKRKWLWGIGAFFGLCSLQMNWTTGQLGVQWLTVQLIDFGVTRGLSDFSPWMLKMTLPVDAVLILAGVWANPGRARKPAARVRRTPLSMDDNGSEP